VKRIRGRKNMTAAVKPARAAVLDFASSSDMAAFLQTANKNSKTNSPGLNRLRELRKKHTPTQERK
jgi:hypothetical protein